jgi:L-alanine-DL-glutamate epimerase-like enolase superfamily enzyme
MKISQIDVYQVDYRFLGGTYTWGGGHSITSVTSTVAKILTDEGIDGFAEICPIGPTYMSAYAGGIPSGVAELGPVLLGQDPRELKKINALMDWSMAGHGYVKALLDIACWDILGKSVGMPICMLLGGQEVAEYPLYRSIPTRSAQEMAELVGKYQAEGYSRFQLKVGEEPAADIKRIRAVRKILKEKDALVADANTGWLMHEAIRVVNAVADEDVYIEQPCRTFEECLAVRQHTRLPMILCESVTGLDMVLRGYKEHAMDGINLKLSRVGGMTKARQIRDLCESLGITMTIEDGWGGDLTTAAISQLSGSTKPDLLFSATDFNSYVDLRLAPDAPMKKNGKMAVPAGPGLGIEIDESLLGKPILTIK